jgi:hypothetical protein
VRDARDHAAKEPPHFGELSSPKRSEFKAQIGRAPIVKISRMMPPTPVAAP